MHIVSSVFPAARIRKPRSSGAPGPGAALPPGLPLVACLLGIALLQCASARADVLPDHDTGPLTGFLGVPDSTEGATLPSRGVSLWDFSFSAASHSIADARLGEELIMDGATTRLEITWRYAVGDGFELGIELPYVWHESGGLDGLVDAWHDIFGLGGGSRALRESDRLEIAYGDASGMRIDLRQNVRGIADARLFAGIGLRRRGDHRLALRFGVELPTGESTDLLGSGGTDISIGLAGDVDGLLGRPGLDGYYRVNAVFVGDSDILGDRRNRVLGHGAVGVGRAFGDRIELWLQAAVRSAAFDSGIEVLGDVSATVTFGGDIRLGRKLRLGLGLSEDLKVRSAPDVVFRVALRYARD